MYILCEECGVTYDDVYRLTICPHDGFDMMTLVMRSDGKSAICVTVEALRHWLGDADATPPA